MPDSIPQSSLDLPQITARNDTARQIVAGFAADMPTLYELWRHLQATLHDTPALVTEITGLRAGLRQARLDHANLLAAARATLAADHDGEHDPLWYLRDELNAHRAGSPSPRRRA